MTLIELLTGWNAIAGSACLAMLIKSKLVARVHRIEKHLDLPPLPASAERHG